MPYLGVQTLKDAEIKRGSATGNGSTTAYAIGWTPPSEQSLFITINGVTQQDAAYTISGSTLTFAAAPANADAIEWRGIQSSGTVITPADGTVAEAKLADEAVVTAKMADNAITNAKMADDAVGVAELSATGTASATTFLRGDNSWVAAGGSNAPAFHISKTDGNQNIGDDTTTKITFNNTVFDTGSGVDLSNNKYVVPSGEGGKYFVYGQANMHSSSSHAMQEGNLQIRVNNTNKFSAQLSMGNNPHAGDSYFTSGILVLAAADYLELWGHTQVNGGNGNVGGPAAGNHTFFGAFKLDGIA